MLLLLLNDSAIEHELPLRRQVLMCDDLWLVLVVDSKKPSGDCTPTSSPGRFSLAVEKKAREKRPGDEVAHSPTLYARGFKGT